MLIVLSGQDRLGFESSLLYCWSMSAVIFISDDHVGTFDILYLCSWNSLGEFDRLFHSLMMTKINIWLLFWTHVWAYWCCIIEQCCSIFPKMKYSCRRSDFFYSMFSLSGIYKFVKFHYLYVTQTIDKPEVVDCFYIWTETRQLWQHKLFYCPLPMPMYVYYSPQMTITIFCQ